MARQAFVNVAVSQTDNAITDPLSATTLSTGRAFQAIRVYAAYVQTAGTATNITFNSKGSGAGTAIYPLMAAGVNGGAVLPYNPKGWFTTKPGEGLTVTSGAGSTTGVSVVYDWVGI